MFEPNKSEEEAIKVCYVFVYLPCFLLVFISRELLRAPCGKRNPTDVVVCVYTGYGIYRP